jgi:hypothetical protein
MATLRRSSTGRALGTVLSGLIVALSVTVPQMDAGSLAHELAVEGPYHATSCPPAHDHRICTQVSLNLPFAPALQVLRSIPVTVAPGLGAPTAGAPSVLFAPGALPRAPPA